jgi:hypothetical protein
MSKKRPLKTYDLLTFVASDVFPPSSPLGMDILRLMAAYNDLAEILDWMIGRRAIITKPIAWKRARIRMSVQHRIQLGILHEAFVVFDQMQGTPEFKELEERGFLSGRGRQALTYLRKANSGGDSSMRSRLSLCRNQVAFHYDRESFQDGATMFTKMFVEKDRAQTLIMYDGESRAYFYYAEQVRENVAFGFNETDGDSQIDEKLVKYLEGAKALTQEMGRFVDEVFAAYATMKNLLSALNRKRVKE